MNANRKLPICSKVPNGLILWLSTATSAILCPSGSTITIDGSTVNIVLPDSVVIILEV